MVASWVDALRNKAIKFAADLIDKRIHCAAVQAVTSRADLCGPIVIQNVSWHCCFLLLGRIGPLPLVDICEKFAALLFFDRGLAAS